MKQLVILYVSIFLLTGAALCQTSGTGALAGTVSDSSGAVIPGATVQAVNADTGQQRTAATNADGTYRFSLLPPGAYNVKFSANGFKTTEVPRVTVAVTETPVLDQKLDIGAQAEQVTVDATVEAIQTSNAALGTVLGASQVVSIPMTTRNYTNSLALSAGVSAGVTNATVLGKDGMDFAVNGAGNGSNNLQIDGANVVTILGSGSNSDNFGGNASNPVPNPDSLQEFKVQTSSYDAGYGRNAGANVNAVTKSGTNAFHGTAFEFFRNRDLNANDFFLNLTGKPKEVLNQNQYGGVIGGPIKKDKLFFFFSYQGTNQKNGAAIQANDAITLPPIPTGNRNTAGFQAAVGASFCPANHPGSSQYNTLHGGVQIACDGSNVNPVAISLMQATLPNGSYLFPGSTNGAFQNTNNSIPAYFYDKQGVGNIDYLLSSKHTLALRFFNSYAPATLSYFASIYVPGFQIPALFFDTTAQAKLTSVLGSSLVNEARLSMHREVANNYGNNSGMSDHRFGITPVSPYQDNNLPGFMSTFVITGAYDVGGSTNGNDFSIGNTIAYQVADQISWTHGKHTVRTGFEIEQLRLIYDFTGLGSGNINISTFADFLLGLPGCPPPATTCTTPGTNGTAFSNIGSTSYADGLSSAGNPHMFHLNDYSAFVNDDYKVNQRLTLNLGLRYEYDGMTREVYGISTNVWPSAILTVPVPGSTPATGSLAGWVVPNNYPGVLLPGLTRASSDSSLQSGPPKDNFAPRFGFAWQPVGGNKFVVRGGYGFFYDRVPANAFEYTTNNAPPNAPPSDKTGAANYASTLAVPFAPTQFGTFPTRWVNFATSTSSSLNNITTGPIWKTPLIYSYNLGVQYQLFTNWVLEAGYVGSHGLHIEASVNPNSALLGDVANPVNGVTTDTTANAVLRQPYLGYGAISNNCTCFTTHYNSVQLTLRKQLSHGLQFQAAYTYARAFASLGSPDPNNYALNYGPSTVYHPQRVSINYLYNLPSGNFKGVASKLLGGWSLSGITTIQDGTPITITDGRGGTAYGLVSSTAEMAPGKTYANVMTPGGLTSRLGGAAGGCGYFTSPTTAGSLNGASCGSLSAFTTVPLALAPDGTVTGGTGWGNAGVGIVLGPGQFNFDAALSKLTRVRGIHEDSTLQFRVELFNMFNHPQFANPTAVVSSGTFGQITSATVNPRLIQVALKYIF